MALPGLEKLEELRTQIETDIQADIQTEIKAKNTADQLKLLSVIDKAKNLFPIVEQAVKPVAATTYYNVDPAEAEVEYVPKRVARGSVFSPSTYTKKSSRMTVPTELSQLRDLTPFPTQYPFELPKWENVKPPTKIGIWVGLAAAGAGLFFLLRKKK